MNGRVSKKMRKLARRNWFEYLNAIMAWPYTSRLRFAWYIVKPWGKKKKRGR